jgi:hypothetical protein
MQLRNGKQLLSAMVSSTEMVSSTVEKSSMDIATTQKTIHDCITQNTINDCITHILRNKITAFSEVQSKLCIGDVDRLNEEIRLLSEMYYIIEEYDLQQNPQFAKFMNMVFIKSPEFYREISVRITPENIKYKAMFIHDRKAAEKMLLTLRKYM